MHGPRHLDRLEGLALRTSRALPVHVEIDTGMTRGGTAPRHAASLIDRILSAPHLRLAGVMTQFADAAHDPAWCVRQMQRFDAVIGALTRPLPRDVLLHAANSWATARDASLHRSMVRVGQAWAGYLAGRDAGAPKDDASLELRPSVRWLSRVIHVHDVEAGRRVGYGGLWTATRPSRIALVPVGYGDGYPKALGEPAGHAARKQHVDRTMVGIMAKSGDTLAGFAPVVGAVNMDQITIDITDFPNVGVGNLIEVIGNEHDHPNALTTLASRANTSHYEMLCRLGPRLPRLAAHHNASPDIEVLARA